MYGALELARAGIVRNLGRMEILVLQFPFDYCSSYHFGLVRQSSGTPLTFCSGPFIRLGSRTYTSWLQGFSGPWSVWDLEHMMLKRWSSLILR